MKAIRALAVVILALVGLYYVLRAAATACVGAACDAYIPFSLLLPLLILVTSAVTGTVAIAHARRGSAWFGALVAVTLLGVFGPVAALLVFKDSPDVFVPLATALEVLVALVVLGYSLARGVSTR